MALLRTAFRTIIQSSKATKWVRKETLLVNLWDSSKKDRTDQSAYQVFDSQQSWCRCRCRWVLGIFLVKIELPSLIFTAVEKLGREKQLYQGGEQQSKERRGPLSIHSGATCKPNMSSGIKDRKLVMLTPIKTPAPQAGLSRKETWESWRKSPSKAKKPSKLLSQQVYNKTELTAWEIKHSHQVYCCL